jgi:hypothetical protein
MGGGEEGTVPVWGGCNQCNQKNRFLREGVCVWKFFFEGEERYNDSGGGKRFTAERQAI